jgi:tRNA (guanine-N7-)-methyltransferase
MTTRPVDSDPRFHGRRRGRKLRPGRERLLETALPARSITLPDGDDPVDPRIWFPDTPKSVWLEIGFGAGEHLAWQAAANPGTGFIGAEPYLNGVARLLSELTERELPNIRLLPDDVRPLMERLEEACLARVFILFPDPWPKQRHHQRRIINSAMLDDLARVMEDDAELRLATDDQSYLVWMLRHLEADERFEWMADRMADWSVRPDDWPDTRYEGKNRSGGPGSTFLRYRRVPRQPD